MTQMTSGGTRRGGASLDMYTGLALAGTVALIVAAVILWMAGAELASTDTQSAMPWDMIGR